MSKESSIFDIIYFAPCKYNQGVGGSARLTNMCRVLNEIGLKIHLISYVNGNRFKIEKDVYSDLLSATTLHVPRNYPKVLKFMAMFPILIYGIKKINKTNLIFTQAPSIVTGFPGVILKKIFKKPLVVDHIDIKDSETPLFLCKYVMKNSTMVFALTKHLMKDAEKMGSDNVFHIPLFLDTDFFNRDLRERSKLRKKLGISKEDIVIGYAGTLSHVEGVPILLKAFKNLHREFKNTKLIVIGVQM
jgi:Glycosyltransferase